jgi:hypothetical protein
MWHEPMGQTQWKLQWGQPTLLRAFPVIRLQLWWRLGAWWNITRQTLRCGLCVLMQ